MLTLARDDRRADALRVFERLKKGLRRELDADPAPAVREVAEAVRAGEQV